MRILDVNNKELTEKDLDYEKGYVISDRLFVAHHDEIPEASEEFHYEVGVFYFEDGTTLDVSEVGNADPHVKIIDQDQGVFDYIDMGEGKTLRGIDVRYIVDKEQTEHKDAYDEYEDIQRYILYTEAELADRKAKQEKAKKQQDFIEQGPEQLQANTDSIDDLYITIADITAGSGA